jgi:hypothetical protein
MVPFILEMNAFLDVTKITDQYHRCISETCGMATNNSVIPKRRHFPC